MHFSPPRPLSLRRRWRRTAVVLVALGLLAGTPPAAATARSDEGAASPRAAAAAPGPVNVGVNIPSAGSWTRAFVDAAKTARAYDKASGGGLATTDSSGWPTQDAQVLMWDYRPIPAWTGTIDDPQKFQPNMSGTYRLSFNGQGVVSVAEGTASVRNKTYDAGSNTTKADVVVPSGVSTSANMLYLKVTSTKRTPTAATGSGFTKLKLIRPGYEGRENQLYTDSWLRTLRSANFTTIRTMEWNGTNNTNPDYPGTISWNQRKLPTDATQEKWGAKQDGVSWEYSIAMANELDKDLWVNVPVHASWNYMTSLATLLRDTLEPGRKVYVEYSNEVWNWSFWQATYNKAYADANGLSYVEAYARRTVEMANAFGSVFGAGSLNNRVRVINAWQIGWQPPDFQYREQMTYIQNTYGPPKNYIWALGVAPYMGCASACDTGSPSAIVSQMQASSDGSVDERKLVKGVATQFQLPGGMVAYEGGTDTGGGSATNVANKITAERSAGLKSVIQRDLTTNWRDAGGGLFMYFHLVGPYSRYGGWGLTDDITNPDRNSKFAAIRAVD